MKTVIILIKEDEIEAWANITALCNDKKDFSYYYLKRKKFPFEYKGHTFIRLEIQR